MFKEFYMYKRALNLVTGAQNLILTSIDSIVFQAITFVGKYSVATVFRDGMSKLVEM